MTQPTGKTIQYPGGWDHLSLEIYITHFNFNFAWPETWGSRIVDYFLDIINESLLLLPLLLLLLLLLPLLLLLCIKYHYYYYILLPLAYTTLLGHTISFGKALDCYAQSPANNEISKTIGDVAWPRSGIPDGWVSWDWSCSEWNTDLDFQTFWLFDIDMSVYIYRYRYIYIYDIWHIDILTYWHMTYDIWHMTYDIWHIHIHMYINIYSMYDMNIP